MNSHPSTSTRPFYSQMKPHYQVGIISGVECLNYRRKTEVAEFLHGEKLKLLSFYMEVNFSPSKLCDYVLISLNSNTYCRCIISKKWPLGEAWVQLNTEGA